MRAFEEVNGIIVGGEWKTGRLFYEGRPQREQFTGDTDEDLRAKADIMLRAIKDECGQAFEMIYPNSVWELRIFN